MGDYIQIATGTRSLSSTSKPPANPIAACVGASDTTEVSSRIPSKKESSVCSFSKQKYPKVARSPNPNPT